MTSLQLAQKGWKYDTAPRLVPPPRPITITQAGVECKRQAVCALKLDSSRYPRGPTFQEYPVPWAFCFQLKPRWRVSVTGSNHRFHAARVTHRHTRLILEVRDRASVCDIRAVADKLEVVLRGRQFCV